MQKAACCHICYSLQQTNVSADITYKQSQGFFAVNAGTCFYLVIDHISHIHRHECAPIDLPKYNVHCEKLEQCMYAIGDL